MAARQRHPVIGLGDDIVLLCTLEGNNPVGNFPMARRDHANRTTARMPDRGVRDSQTAYHDKEAPIDTLVELRELIDGLPGLAWTALPDGRVELLSRRWLDYTGLTAAEAVGLGWIK